MGGYGNRNMYYATGLPGWMRFGYSPGWQGRSASGLGPCAEYIMTGRWPTPQMQQAFQAGAGMGPAAGGFNELDYLKRQSELLTQQLENISKRIDDLEKADE
ncbi:MAG: hypothetical protein PHP28_04950 [Actinomycetota bacterium]|nr:hypothetical protein [Actinomycetota bacterium]MDD5665903.1 hypothetical protein [Actinomycetota bacterium]